MIAFFLTQLAVLLNFCANITIFWLLQKEVEKAVAFALTIFDHVEVFLEMAAYGSGQNTTRWLVVACIQVAKFVLLHSVQCILH
jgi:hypothetical protein